MTHPTQSHHPHHPPRGALRRYAWAGAWSLPIAALLTLALPWPLAWLLGLTLTLALHDTAHRAKPTACHRCQEWVWTLPAQRQPRVFCCDCFDAVRIDAGDGDDLKTTTIGSGSPLAVLGVTALVYVAAMLTLLDMVFTVAFGG